MKLRVKMTLGAVTLLALILGISASLLISASFDSMLESEKASALRTYYSVQTTLELVNSVGAQSDYGDIVEALKAMESREREMWEGVQLSSEAEILYRSGVGADEEETESGRCVITSLSRGDGHYMQLSGALIVNEQKLSLCLVCDITEIYELRASQVSVYRRLLIVTVLIGAAGAWIMASVLTRPLTKLTRASRQIAGGDLTGRANVHSGDELEELSREFNAMADRLEANIEELRASVDRQTAFMGSFAHELKTPMTSIIGYSDLLRRRMLSEEEAQEAANYIFSESRRLEALSIKLQDLIMLKKRDFELTEAEPAAIISGVVRIMRPTLAGAGVTLRYKAGEGRCLLEPDLVKSLLINLVDNARKAMDGEGAVFILSEMTEDGCKISVTDNGRGIPAGELERIKEAFYRVDKSRSRAQGGVGLGLALCDEIAKLHNGTLTVRSVEGRGTSITAELKGGRI